MTNKDALTETEAPKSGVAPQNSLWGKAKRGLLVLCLGLLLILLGYILGERRFLFGGEGAVSQIMSPWQKGSGNTSEGSPKAGVVEQPTALYLDRSKPSFATVPIPDSYSPPWFLSSSATLDLDPPNDNQLVLFREMVRERPGDAYAHRNLGAALLRKGEVAKAIVEFRICVTLAPNDPSLHNDLAVALYMKGERQAGFEQLREAANLDPSQKTYAHSNKIAVEFEGKYDEALTSRTINMEAETKSEVQGKPAASAPATSSPPN